MRLKCDLLGKSTVRGEYKIKKKMKPLLPSLKEKKRYLAFNIISKNPINSFKAVSEAIWHSSLKYLGIKCCAEAGIWLVDNTWDKEKQNGIIRVNNKHVHDLKTSLMFVTKIQGSEVIVRSLGVSGILNKAQKKYIAC